MAPNLGFYTKSLISIGAAGVAILVAALSDGVVSPVEIVNIAIAILTATTVYLVPNLPAGPARIAKTLVAFGGAAAAALANILAIAFSFGAVTLADWLTVLLAGLGAIGVYIVPNASLSDNTEVTAAVVNAQELARQAQEQAAKAIVFADTATSQPELPKH